MLNKHLSESCCCGALTQSSVGIKSSFNSCLLLIPIELLINLSVPDPCSNILKSLEARSSFENIINGRSLWTWITLYRDLDGLKAVYFIDSSPILELILIFRLKKDLKKVEVCLENCTRDDYCRREIDDMRTLFICRQGDICARPQIANCCRV